MTRIQFDCDRCGRHVDGLHAKSGTAGFYVVDDGLEWAKYRIDNPQDPSTTTKEHFVCDQCVQSMPAYQKAYGRPVSA